MARVITDTARKVFAVLVERNLGYALASFIESELTDGELPVDEKRLEDLLPKGDVKGFVSHQWEYLVYTFRKGLYQRRIRTEKILPYIEERKIGHGGYSNVYEVFVHPAHQEFCRAPPENVRNLYPK